MGGETTATAGPRAAPGNEAQFSSSYLLRARVYLPCAVPARPLLGELYLCGPPRKQL